MPHTPCVVGINLGHDGGAALITYTTMVAIGEERLNRTRYSPGWQPSLLYCLRAAGLTLSDVDLVAVSGIGRTPPTRAETGLTHLGIDPARIIPVDHHLSHAYTACFLSPYDEATVLVVDGGGNNNDIETYYRTTLAGIERLGDNLTTRASSAGIGATYEAPAPTPPASPTSPPAPDSTSARTAAAARTNWASTPPPTSRARPSVPCARSPNRRSPQPVSATCASRVA
ncbi:hypothetical protein ACFRIC_16545 [Streptomyces sp. NPDC056738]|uniref:hypothetical protein n=1 Tax=Streptomyces sp. NPDC056738 TaxID=3345933 RepID=UPI003685C214